MPSLKRGTHPITHYFWAYDTVVEAALTATEIVVYSHQCSRALNSYSTAAIDDLIVIEVILVIFRYIRLENIYLCLYYILAI